MASQRASAHNDAQPCFPTGAVRQRPWPSRERDARALASLVNPRQSAHDCARGRAAGTRGQPLGRLGSSKGVCRRCDGEPLARLPREPGAHPNPREIYARLDLARKIGASHLSSCECSPRRLRCFRTGGPCTRWSHRTSGWPSGRRVGGDARVRRLPLMTTDGLPCECSPRRRIGGDARVR